MSDVRFSPAALRDLNEILDYIAADKPATARNVVARIRASCERLGAFPNRGELLEYLGPKVRRITVGSYNIFYRPKGDGTLLIMRVRHGARDEPDDNLDE
jgi:toxin ParE1/3/4